MRAGALAKAAGAESSIWWAGGNGEEAPDLSGVAGPGAPGAGDGTASETLLAASGVDSETAEDVGEKGAGAADVSDFGRSTVVGPEPAFDSAGLAGGSAEIFESVTAEEAGFEVAVETCACDPDVTVTAPDMTLPTEEPSARHAANEAPAIA